MNREWKVAICPQCGGYTVCAHIQREHERRDKFEAAVRDGDRIEYVTEAQLKAIKVCPGHQAGQTELFGGKQ